MKELLSKFHKPLPRMIGAVALVLLIIVVLAVFFLKSYLTSIPINPTQASAPKVSVTITSTQYSYPQQSTVLATVIIKPADLSNKLTGFDLTFSTSGLSIVQIGQPASFPDGTTSQFTQLDATNKHIAYIVSTSQSQLPSIVTIPVTLQGTKGRGKLTVKLNQATGTMLENVFDATNAKATVTFTFGATPTGVPVSPTPISNINPTQGLPPGGYRMPPQRLPPQ